MNFWVGLVNVWFIDNSLGACSLCKPEIGNSKYYVSMYNYY